MIGERGPHGDHGQQGDTGLTGLKGDTGDEGIKGIEGLQGRRGPKGDQGEQGKSEVITTWFGWTRWRWATIAFVWLVLAGTFSVYTQGQTAKNYTEQLVLYEKMQGVQRAKSNCDTINILTNKIRVLVTAATSGQISVDYTAIPEFQLLSKNEQTFFLALRMKSQTEGNATARTEFMKGLDLRDCEKEFPILPPP